jgi:hypothetical protein
MSHPDWECIANLGDVNPIDHGGKFVLVDKTGVYPPEMEVLEPLEPCGQEAEVWQVWRFPMDRCTYIDGVLSDNPYHPDKPAWFADDISDIASMYGVERDELIGQLCSEAPRERAEGYYCLFGYYPAENFDSYPLDLDRAEVEERYADAPYNVEV